MNISIYSEEQQDFYHNGGERPHRYSYRHDANDFLSMFTFHWTPLESDTAQIRRWKRQANRAHLIFLVYSFLLFVVWVCIHASR